VADENQLPRSQHVAQFDGLRGLLALWVVVTHIICWCGWTEAILQWPFGRYWKELLFAQPAVEVFIILSGFAITLVLQERRPSYLAFMTGRFFRIYPTYAVCLIIGIASIGLTPAVLNSSHWRGTVYYKWVAKDSIQERARTSEHIVAHTTLLYGLPPAAALPSSTSALLPPAWSISLEWQYYLLAPALALLMRRSTGLILVTLVSWLGLHYSALWQNPHLSFLPAQLPLFAIGIGSYHLFDRQTKELSTYSTLPSAILITVAILSQWKPVTLILWAVAYGSVFADGGSSFARVLRAASRVLCHPLLQFLGRISYPLYLLHWPLIVASLFVMLQVWPSVNAAQATLLMFGLSLPLMLIGAYVLHRGVETPGMALGKRLAMRIRTRPLRLTGPEVRILDFTRPAHVSGTLAQPAARAA